METIFTPATYLSAMILAGFAVLVGASLLTIVDSSGLKCARCGARFHDPDSLRSHLEHEDFSSRK